MFKFVKDVDEAMYIPFSKIVFIETVAETVKVYLVGRGADNVGDDYIDISCTATTEVAIADKLAMHASGDSVLQATITVDVNYASGITGIAYVAA
tara:strand:- start:77 stop:361 length:285 start_codon:yes stop_codon:yes gene_type:complete